MMVTSPNSRYPQQHPDPQRPLIYSDFPGLTLLRRERSRDVYDLGDALLLVATDRWPLPGQWGANGFPGKGRLVNQLSALWFRRLRRWCANHLVSSTEKYFPPALARDLANHPRRCMLTYKTVPLPVRCVVRGYLAGPGWLEYRERGAICGQKLAAGLLESQRLPAPLFAPVLQAGPEAGEEQNIEFASLRKLVGGSLAGQMREASLQLYFQAWRLARERGVLIADTEFRFGLLRGTLTLIDDCLTQDTSRFWPLETYGCGNSLAAMDHHLLDGLEGATAGGSAAGAEGMLLKIGDRYREAFRRLAGARALAELQR